MVIPWRMITGAEPDAIKVASPVLNGEDEETDRKELRLVLTQQVFRDNCRGAWTSRSERRKMYGQR